MTFVKRSWLSAIIGMTGLLLFSMDLNAQIVATPAEKANARYIDSAVIEASRIRREANGNGSSESEEGQEGKPYQIDGPAEADRASKQGYTLVPRAHQGFWWYVSCGSVQEYYDDLITILFGNANCNTAVIKLFNAGDTLQASYEVRLLGDYYPFSAGQILTGSQTVTSEMIPGNLFATSATGGNCSSNFQYQWQYSYNDTLYWDIDSSTVGDSLVLGGEISRSTWFRRKVICSTDTMYTASVGVFLIPPMNGGVITTPSQFINSNTAPPAINATPASNGISDVFTYKWQISTDGYVYTDISGATNQNLTYTTPLTSARYFRRKATSDTIFAYTNPVLFKINTPPPVYPINPQNSIDTLLTQAGIANLPGLFTIYSDSVANNRPAPNPTLDSLDIKARQKLELSPFNEVYTGLEQSDVNAILSDTLEDNIQQLLLKDSLGIIDTTIKPAFIPFMDDSTINSYISTSNFHGLDSVVNLSPQVSFEDAALLIDQAQNAGLPPEQRSYVPSVLPAGYRPGAVINGQAVMPFPYTGSSMHYTGSFYFTPGTTVGSIKWIANGGTIISQNTNPSSGTLYADVVWNNTSAAHFIALYDMETKQFDLLNIYVIPVSGMSYPPLQKLYFGQTPCLVQSVSSCTGMNGWSYTFKWQQFDVYATNPMWTDIAGSVTTANQPTHIVTYQPASLTRPWVMYRLVSSYTNGGPTYSCTGSAMSIQLEKPDGGIISCAVTDFAFNTIPVVTQTASNGGYTPAGASYTYAWEYSINGGSWTEFGYGQAYPNYAIRYSNTRIRRKITISASVPAGYSVPAEYTTAYSNEITFTTHYQTADFENRNYIRENTVLVKNVAHWEDADALVTEKKIQVTTFLDGLSRPIQTVGKGTHYDENNSQWYDMVHSVTYVAGGRVDKALLPYPTTDNPGKFKTNVATAQPAYYQSKFGEGNAYSKVDFDGSPFDNILKVYAPGDSWAGNNTGVSGNVEVYVAANDLVRKWTVGYNEGEVPVSTSAYPYAGLIKSWALDEKGKKVITYTDINGNVVLKKVQLAEGAQLTSHHDGWLCTYYVYDDFNQLRFTITPKAVKEAKENNWVLTQTITDELCFWYDYDEQGRARAKKTPGKGVEYIVYDRRQRPVFTQDANARVKGEWLTVFYDQLNRPVMTGIYKSAATQTQMQTVYDGIGANMVTLSATNGGTFKVNYCSFTSTEINNTALFTLLTFSYYDDYTFSGKKDIDLSENNKLPYKTTGYLSNLEEWYNTRRTTGMPTGGKTRVLTDAATQYLSSTIYYDEEGRAIQSLADNIKGGTDISSVQYHWDGRALSKVETHNNPGTVYTNFSTVTKYKFDKIGRVTGIGKKLGTNLQVNYTDLQQSVNMPDIQEEKDEKFKVINKYKYNELGQVVKKTLSPNYNSGAGLETIDFSYNIRGWLTGINKDYALAENNGNQWEHYFGMYIGYDNRDGKFAAAQVNGQATGVQWKSQGDNIARRYDYVYDNANRLIAANFKQFSDGSWNNTKVDFSSKEITYDENGNLLTLTQMGVLPGGTAPIFLDKLNYLYNTKSNKLFSVSDIGGNPGNGKQGDFKDGGNGSNADYSYDANGNMVTDNNKRISAITYNYLDKPELMTIAAPAGGAGGGTIKYIYSAGGSKLQKIVTENPTPANGNQTVITTTTYIGAFVYVQNSTAPPPAGGDGGLQMIGHEEGRIRIITPYINASDPGNLLSGGISMPGGKQGVFDYFILDNLANVRATITEEINKAAGVCTMEDANATIKQNEEATFGNPGAGNEVNGTRVNRPGLWQANSSNRVSKLEALNNVPKTGPNALLKVMAGDKIRAMTDYYYVQDPGSSNSQGLNAMVSSFITSLAGGRTAAATHGQEAAISGGLTGNPALGNFFTNPATPDANPNAPRAYLNWIFFDEQFNFVQQVSGFKRVSQAGDGAAPIVTDEIKAIKNGYVYVYLSNESSEPVYFDNFSVSHERGQLIGEDHYYAYGLKIAAISSKSVSSSLNKDFVKRGYQGAFAEEVAEFELNYIEFFYRTYDPQIGRWTTPDPYDQFASPYSAMGMDPVNNTDPTGGIVLSWPPPGMRQCLLGLNSSVSTTASTLSSVLTAVAKAASLLSVVGNAMLSNINNTMANGMSMESMTGETPEESVTWDQVHLAAVLSLVTIETMTMREEIFLSYGSLTPVHQSYLDVNISIMNDNGESDDIKRQNIENIKYWDAEFTFLAMWFNGKELIGKAHEILCFPGVSKEDNVKALMGYIQMVRDEWKGISEAGRTFGEILLSYAVGETPSAKSLKITKAPKKKVIAGTSKTVLTRVERLSKFKDNLSKAAKPTNPKDALKLINKTLDDIESKYAGASDRMFGILDDKFVTYHSNGSVTALTRGHRIEIQANGSFSIFDRKTGELFYKN